MFVSQTNSPKDKEGQHKQGDAVVEVTTPLPPPPQKYRLNSISNSKDCQPKTVTMAIDVPSVWLWLADDESWERFDVQETAVIGKAIAKGHKGAILHRGDTSYFLDLVRLTQTSVVSGRRRPIYNVQKGRATWLVQQGHGGSVQGGWVSFSRKETHQLEDAFFAGSDFAVLNLDDGRSCYVDLAKWTLTCFSSNVTVFIKVTPDTTISSHHAAAPVTTYTPTPTIVTNSNRTRSNSPQHYKRRLSDGDTSASERTSTTTALAEDYDYPSLSANYDDDTNGDTSNSDRTLAGAPILVKNEHATSTGRLNKSQAQWRWHNDNHDWSNFDDEFTDAIERSWATGANDMVFQRGQTQYYIDLQNLTQTNIDTGRVRPIQRLSNRNNPLSSSTVGGAI